MTALSEETARELIEVIRELTFVVKGLTGVLIDDRDADPEEAEGEAAGAPATAPTYMDGSPVGG